MLKNYTRIFLAVLTLCAVGGVFWYHQASSTEMTVDSPSTELPLPFENSALSPAMSSDQTQILDFGTYSQDQLLTEVTEQLVEKNGFNPDEIFVSVSHLEGRYTRGSVGLRSGGAVGNWLAVYDNDSWSVFWDGVGSLFCDDLDEYPDLPTTVIQSCFDRSTGEIIKR